MTTDGRKDIIQKAWFYFAYGIYKYEYKYNDKDLYTVQNIFFPKFTEENT